ncbi:MAG: late competence development ComFB family protein, partial [Candidatus Omnitrophota bacterium]
MEVLADDILVDLLTKHKDRLSDNAIQDVKALALNRLWPMYITSNSGKDFIKKIVVEDKIEKEVVRELRAAIDVV